MRLTLVRFVRSPHPNDLVSQFKHGTKQFANLPERYLMRKSQRLLFMSPPIPSFVPKLVTTKVREHKLDRPWSNRYAETTDVFKERPHHATLVQPIPDRDWMWFRGDRVEILTGKDAGKQGYINYVVQENNWVCVEGLNCKHETMGDSKDFPGILMSVEQPLNVLTDIRLVDPTDEKITDVVWRYTDEGIRVRVSERTGFEIPFPTEANTTIDYKTPKSYVANKEKDTLPQDVEEITFEPKLATFEMEIMELHGIKEHRTPQKTFFY